MAAPQLCIRLAHKFRLICFLVQAYHTGFCLASTRKARCIEKSMIPHVLSIVERLVGVLVLQRYSFLQKWQTSD